MKLYEYVITRDFGFAPNPYYGLCTLATCKPKIRRTAQISDWIVGFGGSATSVRGRLVYIMKVSEKITFDEYWQDEIFNRKKPTFLKGDKASYGDNIYHHDGQLEWKQENSHHSLEDGINYVNLKKDTSQDAVLISDKFWYFGNNACKLPSKFNSIIFKGRAHKIERNEGAIKELIEWLSINYEEGINGIPVSLVRKSNFVRFAGDK